MPTTINLSKSYVGINPAVVSVTGWLFPGPPFDYPQPPEPVPTPETEVPLSQAHFLIYEGFTAKNGRGTSLGRGSIDTGTQTCLQVYQATDLETLLAAAFPG